MGTDKALLRLNNETLLERTLRTAANVTDAIFIVGSRERYARYGEVVEDIFPDCGPLGGIHAALSITQSDMNLMLSVDMPGMESAFLAWLLQQARTGPELVVVPETRDGLQPLAAIYCRPLRAVVEQTLRSGQYKIGNLFPLVPTRYIAEAEIRAAGFSPTVFGNVNTLAEYQDLLRETGGVQVKGSGE
jgi:molybdopterin-guanine dinucleotide biosynthesis protein A